MSEQIRTSDLALASLLRLHGFAHLFLERIDGRGAWVYNCSANLRVLIDQYDAGRAQVEPLEFMRAQKLVRDDLYRFLRET